MLDASAPTPSCTSIDPVPEFDPAEHEQRFPGRYIFHRDAQPQRAPDAPADGRSRSSTATTTGTPSTTSCGCSPRAPRRGGAPLPVLIMHDVLLAVRPPRPLLRARRRSPRSSASRTRRRACGPGPKQLLPTRRPEPRRTYNAVIEGGPRNGVMTALDDFIAEYDRPLRRARAARSTSGSRSSSRRSASTREPELAAAARPVRERPTGKDDLLELAEDDAAPGDPVPAQRLLRRADAARPRPPSATSTCSRPRCSTSTTSSTSCASSTSRDCIEHGQRRPTATELGDPAREMQLRLATQLVSERRVRRAPRRRAADVVHFPYTDMGRDRLDHLAPLPRRRANRARSPATSSSAAPAAAAARSSCAATSTRTSIADARGLGRRRFRVARTDRRRSPSSASPGSADLNLVRDGFARFESARRPRAVPAGPAGATRSPDAPIEQVALLRIGAARRDDVARRARRAVRPRSRSAAS